MPQATADAASDIRGEYGELLEDQVPDDEATARIIEPPSVSDG